MGVKGLTFKKIWLILKGGAKKAQIKLSKILSGLNRKAKKDALLIKEVNKHWRIN